MLFKKYLKTVKINHNLETKRLREISLN